MLASPCSVCSSDGSLLKCLKQAQSSCLRPDRQADYFLHLSPVLGPACTHLLGCLSICLLFPSQLPTWKLLISRAKTHPLLPNLSSSWWTSLTSLMTSQPYYPDCFLIFLFIFFPVFISLSFTHFQRDLFSFQGPFLCFFHLISHFKSSKTLVLFLTQFWEYFDEDSSIFRCNIAIRSILREFLTQRFTESQNHISTSFCVMLL